MVGGEGSLFEQEHSKKITDQWSHLCKQGFKPERDEVFLSGLDLKLLWGYIECLVFQDALLYNQVGPLTKWSNLVTVYVHATL